ncbi:MAG TPA: hypothetical protein PLJ60_10605 [Chryseolinea sp.]|nr:hypothetical protein [Chryseolinea sp.]HPH46166.1 hypothetical protein [Chryseolinea sp.]HPM30771.1 hypothetical protein [Chryseolinea sp.]
MKNLLLKFVLLIPIFGQVACGEDIAECPTKMCVMSGGWKLTEVFIDGVKDSEDLSKYQLILNSPTPKDAIISDFDRTQPSGTTDNGSWSIENNQTILRLIPDNDPLLTEDWLIESFTLRKLVLVITRDVSTKGGPAEIRFVLEPF